MTPICVVTLENCPLDSMATLSGRQNEIPIGRNMEKYELCDLDTNFLTRDHAAAAINMAKAKPMSDKERIERTSAMLRRWDQRDRLPESDALTCITTVIDTIHVGNSRINYLSGDL